LRIGTGDAPGIALEQFREVPLRRWVAVSDSKLSFGGMTKTLLDLAKIDRELTRLRTASRNLRDT
jgi:hypothetical protein